MHIPLIIRANPRNLQTSSTNFGMSQSFTVEILLGFVEISSPEMMYPRNETLFNQNSHLVFHKTSPFAKSPRLSSDALPIINEHHNKLSKNGENILFIKLLNIIGAFITPNGITDVCNGFGKSF